MKNEASKNKLEINGNARERSTFLPSEKYISATIPFVMGFVLGIVIPFEMFVAFKDGCTETLQIRTPDPVEIIHYHPALMVVCVLIMSLFYLGIYALYCHFVRCMVQEDRKTEKIRKDLVLKKEE